MKYLLSQSKLFSHFLGDARSAPVPAAGTGAAIKKGGAAAAVSKDAPDSVTKRRRLTEKEEDAQLLRTEEAELPPTTRLSVQPSNINGQMRPYQLEGLNFLISLFERGVNGILADEMGLVRVRTRGGGAGGEGGNDLRGRGVLRVKCIGGRGVCLSSSGCKAGWDPVGLASVCCGVLWLVWECVLTQRSVDLAVPSVFVVTWSLVPGLHGLSVLFHSTG